MVRQFTDEGGVVLDMTGSSATAALASAVEGRNAIYVEGDSARIYDAFCRTDTFFASEKRKIQALGMQLHEEELPRESTVEGQTPYAAGAVRERGTPAEEEVAMVVEEIHHLIIHYTKKRKIPDLLEITRFWLSSLTLESFRALTRNMEDLQVLEDMIKVLNVEEQREKMASKVSAI